jgi:cobalamin biosynthesis protein CobD/CbiB
MYALCVHVHVFHVCLVHIHVHVYIQVHIHVHVFHVCLQTRCFSEEEQSVSKAVEENVAKAKVKGDFMTFSKLRCCTSTAQPLLL